MKVRIVNKSTNEVPAYSTEHSAGMDVCAFIEKEIIVKPLERKLISTGLYLEIPIGYEAQIRPRSGLAIKEGLTILNTPGTIDADYRGEVGIIVINLSDKDICIRNGERICQMIINKVEHIEWVQVEEINDTIRSEGGFGHTGK